MELLNSAVALSILNVNLLVVVRLFHAISFIWSCFTFWGLILLLEHPCVVMRGVLAFTPVPFFSFCPSPWSVFGCPGHPPTAPLPRSWGALSFVVLLSLSSCFSPSASRWAHGFSRLSSCLFKQQEFLDIDYVPTSVPSSISFFQWQFCRNRSHF